MRTAIAALALCLAACGGLSMPQDQAAYVGGLKSLKSAWKAHSDNGILRAEDERAARELFRTQRDVSAWVATIDSVRALGDSVWLEAKSEHATFVLRPPDEASQQVRPAFARLGKGDRVRFWGTLKSELSMTISGAILEPEISVTISKLEQF